jgi:hypothetical protein
MWRPSLLLLALLAGSCTPAQIEKEKLTDGSWHLLCRLPMDLCVLQVEKVCADKHYRILRGESQLNLRGVDFPTELPVSELVVACGDRKVGTPASSAAAAASSASSPSARACVPGATQACVGRGACPGGQACRPDGSGFGPCDCAPRGSPSTDGGPEAGAVSADAGADALK